MPSALSHPVHIRRMRAPAPNIAASVSCLMSLCFFCSASSALTANVRGRRGAHRTASMASSSSLCGAGSCLVPPYGGSGTWPAGPARIDAGGS